MHIARRLDISVCGNDVMYLAGRIPVKMFLVKHLNNHVNFNV